MDRVKRIWYLSPMRAAKVQASLRIRAVSPEPPLLAHTSIESRGTFRQKARSLAPLNGWACAVEICHDGMLEDTNSLGGAQIIPYLLLKQSPKQGNLKVLQSCPSTLCHISHNVVNFQLRMTCMFPGMVSLLTAIFWSCCIFFQMPFIACKWFIFVFSSPELKAHKVSL